MTISKFAPRALPPLLRPRYIAMLLVAMAITLLAIKPYRAEAKRPRLPEIRLSAANQVPVCVTPERLMAYMHTRNRSPRLRRLYKNIAYYYRKHGEELGVRWDYAFFQTLIETNYLTYKTGRGRWGDVKPTAFNFAGIGTTGGGVPGNTFPNVSTGVKAQMQHLIAYSGELQRNPTAARTRLKQKDIVALSRKLRRPVRFDDLAGRWAVDRKYANSIEWIARGYRKKYCTGRMLQIAKAEARARGRGRARFAGVPRPRRITRAIRAAAPRRLTRADRANARAAASARAQARIAASQAKIRNNERARQLALYHQRQQAKEVRSAKGGAGRINLAAVQARKAQQRRQRSDALARKALSKGRADKNNRRSALGAARGFASSPRGTLRPQAPSRCAVVTASYGGQKTLLIKATSGAATTYTALSVLDGFEKSMTDSYLRSNAPGGQLIGEYPTPRQALQRAFALCPDR